MVVLARHLAPDDRGNIDVNECLDEVLSEAGAGMSCTVERRFEAVPVVAASRTELQLIFATCTDYALHALRDMDSAEAKLEVSTVAAGKRVTISFTHNGGWLPPEQRKNQFVPFYASQDQKAGIELPAALYLAKKYQWVGEHRHSVRRPYYSARPASGRDWNGLTTDLLPVRRGWQSSHADTHRRW